MTDPTTVEATAEAEQKSGWAYFGFTLISLAGLIAVGVFIWVTAESFFG